MRTRAGLKLLVVASAGLLAACGSGRPDYAPQSSPPEVMFNGAPPTYVSTGAVTLSITATDTDGVKAVYALCGAQRWAAVKQEDGTWLVTVQLPVVGANTVVVWAEDLTSPTPNSGQGMDSPYQITQTIIYDPTPPSVRYDASYGSYSDERTLQVLVDANGVARVPAAYSIGPRLAIPLGGDIYKASSRLSGGAMTASELETTNQNNVPVLRFLVPFSAGSSAPIDVPTYTAHVTCPSPCGDLPDASGSLLTSATPSSEEALFDLPVSSETIPALTQVQGPATISITITVRDEAGNTSTVPGFNYMVHVIGPPLAIAEDTQYGASLKPESTYAYHLSDNTFTNLWQGTLFPNSRVRLVRYVITNPTPDPVALQLSFAQDAQGSWRSVETWGRYNVSESWARGVSAVSLTDPTNSIAYTLDGLAFRDALFWKLPYSGSQRVSGYYYEGAHPCASDPGGLAYHRMGDRTNALICWDQVPSYVRTGTSETATFSASDVSVLSYRVAPELGGQEMTVTTDSTGTWSLVPGASGSTPGSLVTYVARSSEAPRTRPLQWNLNPTNDGNAAKNHYQTWDYNMWLHRSTYDRPTWAVYTSYRTGWYLESAEDHVFGTLLGNTKPLAGEAGVYGEVAPRLNVSLARVPLASH